MTMPAQDAGAAHPQEVDPVALPRVEQSGRNQTFSACGTQTRSSSGKAARRHDLVLRLGRERQLIGHPRRIGGFA